MKTEDSIDDLKFVRIFDPSHIPQEYIEQIKGREFSVERFYEFQKTICLLQIDDEAALNPMNLLFAIVNQENLVKGVLWMVVDALGNSLIINTFSIDKQY